MKIRRLEEDDIMGALECIHASLRDVNGIDYSDRIIDYLIRQHYTLEWIRRKSEGFFLVAFEGRRIVGTGSANENEIVNLFVHPDFLRRGVGKKLLQQLERNLRRNQFAEVLVNSSSTAVEFYRKMGYFLVSEIAEDLRGEVYSTYFMKKTFV